MRRATGSNPQHGVSHVKAARLCTLSIEQLNALSGRLDEIAELSRYPAYRGDIGLARFAVQDLASLRFGVEEIVREMNAISKPSADTKFSNTVFGFAAQLLALLGYGEE
jgi:hypothetical protein